MSETLKEVDELVTKLAEHRRTKDDLESKKKLVNVEIDTLETRIIALLTEAELKTFQGQAATVTVTERMSVKVPRDPESREAFFNYLKDKGMFESLITVNSQSLNKFYKTEEEVAVQNGEIDFKIPGLEQPTVYPDLSFRGR